MLGFPLLEIQGAGPGERWGLMIVNGFVQAVQFTVEERPDGKVGKWVPLTHWPAKLLEYVDVFIGQYQPWLNPIGMPVRPAPKVLRKGI